MKIKYIKEGKGYNVFVNGKLAMWIIGSKNNAEKEMLKY